MAEGTTTGGLEGNPPGCEPDITKDNHGDTSQGNLGPLGAFAERCVHTRSNASRSIPHAIVRGRLGQNKQGPA
eukprot:6461364-Amphidinium_carterae.1